MTDYRISGVWKDANNVITHYAFHTVGQTSTSRASKVTKARAVELVEGFGNTAYTWVWNYRRGGWDVGERVQVVNGGSGKFLRSDPDNRVTDNLGHLIDYDWILP